jgi:hypothetical protein
MEHLMGRRSQPVDFRGDDQKGANKGWEARDGSVNGYQLASSFCVRKTSLGELGYKYGVAQKLLNLFLKYLWCLGTIAEPPHCPVDRIIIGKTCYKDKNWTEIVQRSEQLDKTQRLLSQLLSAKAALTANS